MEIKNLKLAELRLNPTNPREVVEEKYKQLIDSILVFPKMLELRPVVYNARKEVLGGNMRLRALQDIAQMSLEDIKARLECLEGYRSEPQAERVALLELWQRWLDSPYAPAASAEGLTDAEQQEFIIKDNVSFGKWDWEALANDWDEEQLGEWGLDVWQPEQEEETPETKEDEFDEDGAIEVRCKKGDIWQLGEHRLMCGDSTDSEDIYKLMNGEIADLAVTSPPYNAGCLNIEGQERTKEKYRNLDDSKTESEYFTFLRDNLKILIEVSDEVFYNVGIVSGNKKVILQILCEFKDYFKDFIYWKKSNPVNAIAKGVISSSIELICCFGKNNTRRFKDTHFQNGEYYLGVIEGSVASSNKYSKIHRATFPMYLPENILNNFSSKHSLVLDCFAGTGTTLIAAEQLGRKCYAMEIDTHYCDIILARWEEFTGKQAIKIN